MSRRSPAVLAVSSLVLALSVSFPASAQSDTTPPQLVSLTVVPNQVDPSAGSQTVTVSAVITDDLSGVSDAAAQVWSPTLGQDAQAPFKLVSGDSYVATLTIAQYAEDGIWEVTVDLNDNAGNRSFLRVRRRGFNVALGVGNFPSSFSRSVTIRFRHASASGQVRADAPMCYASVPVILELKTDSGWKRVGRMTSRASGNYKFSLATNAPGKYRVTATAFGIGTPTLTTCLRASARVTSS